MGHGYTGNHPRLTMIHDRELIYDAKQQLHRADMALHAYDNAVTKKVDEKNKAIMTYSSEADNAATMMLPGNIHPLSKVYGKVRNLETYMPVDNRAATKAMVDTDKLGAQGEMVEGIARKKGLLKKGCSYKR